MKRLCVFCQRLLSAVVLNRAAAPSSSPPEISRYLRLSLSPLVEERDARLIVRGRRVGQRRLVRQTNAIFVSCLAGAAQEGAAGVLITSAISWL